MQPSSSKPVASPLPAVSIIIVSYHTREKLRRCLAALEPEHEIIVVDNASTDGSPEMVEQEFPHVRLIRSDTNLGFSAANNCGAAVASNPLHLYLNSDAYAEPGAVKSLASVFRAPLVVAAGCAGRRRKTAQCRRLLARFHRPPPDITGRLCRASRMDEANQPNSPRHLLLDHRPFRARDRPRRVPPSHGGMHHDPRRAPPLERRIFSVLRRHRPLPSARPERNNRLRSNRPIHSRTGQFVRTRSVARNCPLQRRKGTLLSPPPRTNRRTILLRLRSSGRQPPITRRAHYATLKRG